MKRGHFLIISLSLMLALAGCEQKNPSTLSESLPEGASAAPASSTEAPGTTQEARTDNATAFWFSGQMPDPQSMQPTYEAGTLTFEGALYRDGSGGYEAALNLTRYFPQGINFMTWEPQPDGYMNWSYDSIGNARNTELSPQSKTALDEKSLGDNGERHYGLLPMRLRCTANTMQTTGSFYLPMDYKRQYSSTMELPYLLTTDGDKAALYLYLNPLATIKLEGALAVPPAPEAHQSATEAQMIYFNDEGRTPEQNKQKDIWNILFLGEKSGDSYSGTLHLWRWREQTGASPTVLCYVPGEAGVYEQEVSLTFKPFSEAEYLSAGGMLNGRQRAGLSEMAMDDCGGQTVLLTVCDDKVYAELPNVNIGVFEGRFSDDERLSRIADESFVLYQAAQAYHMSSLSPTPTDLSLGLDEVSDAGSAAMMEEYGNTSIGAPSEVPAFIPSGFVKMLNPVNLLEKRPATLIFGNFQYTEDGYYLDDIGPLYRELLAEMRDLQIEEGETGEGTGYEMEITFRYGESTVGYTLMDTAIGTWVQIAIY